MGLLKKLIGGQQEARNQIARSTEGKTRNSPQGMRRSPFPIHPDIANLLWVVDGPAKNIDFALPEESFFEVDGFRFRLSFASLGDDEPSLISTRLPVALDGPMPPRPPYFPRYVELTPEQRGTYWRYLRNPYDGSFDVGYAFLLYYGLERHLFQGSYERAFEVILKMRDSFASKSFQSYSANALVLTCMARKRGDLLERFAESLDKDYELEFDRNLFAACKVYTGRPLSPREIMSSAKAIPGANLNYIRRFPDLFEKQLDRILPDGLDLSLTKELDALPVSQTQVFANTSLHEAAVPIPIFLADPGIGERISEALSRAHEATKAELAELRKSNRAPIEKTNKPKLKPLDRAQEKERVNAVESSKPGTLEHHFAIIQLADHYYKYRNQIPEYLDRCITLCEEDIASLDDIQKSHRQEEISRIADMRKMLGDDWADEELQQYNPNFEGYIPAFKRLAIIYEKQRDLDKAIDVCRAAIGYYAKYGGASSVEEFVDRQNKLIAKEAKSN